jgi:diacylglycerol kinase (ATP)
MHLLLLHNPTAGDEDQHGAALLSLLGKAGHSVLYRSLEDDEWTEALTEARDVTVIAGGDGSVQKVFTALRESPLTTTTLFPTGSANNIARTLGFTSEDPAQLLVGWEPAVWKAFDLWDAEYGSERKTVVESFGGGLFVEVLRRAERKESPNGEEKVELGLELMHEVLSESEPCVWELELDGEHIREPLLGWELMNARELGPNLLLAPNADVGDGMFDLVLIRPDVRSELLAYVERKLVDEHAPPPRLPERRGERLSVKLASGAAVHVDDEVAFQDAAGERVVVRRAPSPIEVLVPALPAVDSAKRP